MISISVKREISTCCTFLFGTYHMWIQVQNLHNKRMNGPTLRRALPGASSERRAVHAFVLVTLHTAFQKQNGSVIIGSKRKPGIFRSGGAR